MKDTANKVIFNTIVLYAKIIITMCISLLTVPMVLRALGESDYGIYNLIAGIVSMLAFLNASMTIATQRYLSVAIGENNSEKLNVIYNTSLCLHLIIGSLIVLILEIAGLFLFDGFLNIPPERIHTAKIVYQFIVASTFFTILSVPYNATMNAKEDMLAFSLIGIFDSIARLSIAFLIAHSSCDRLLLYALLLAILTISVTLINSIYVKSKYREFTYSPRRFLNKRILYEMFGFAGWNTLGAVAMIGRNQGIAILFNVFIGTIANAAYGIANQVNGVLSYFSSTFQKAINPQLMQSQGMNNRERLIRISLWSSKYSVFVLALFAVPLILEMPYILKLWLNEIPDHSIIFCQLILLLSIVYQYSTGLMSAIQAVGKIKNYFIIMSLLIVMNIPISYLILRLSLPPYFCLVAFIVIEVISLIVRMKMAERLVGIRLILFIKKVVIPTLYTIMGACLIAYLVHSFLPESFFRLLSVMVIYVFFYMFFSWKWVIDLPHKEKLRGMIVKFLKIK